MQLAGLLYNGQVSCLLLAQAGYPETLCNSYSTHTQHAGLAPPCTM